MTGVSSLSGGGTFILPVAETFGALKSAGFVVGGVTGVAGFGAGVGVGFGVTVGVAVVAVVVGGLAVVVTAGGWAFTGVVPVAGFFAGCFFGCGLGRLAAAGDSDAGLR